MRLFNDEQEKIDDDDGNDEEETKIDDNPKLMISLFSSDYWNEDALPSHTSLVCIEFWHKFSFVIDSYLLMLIDW